MSLLNRLLPNLPAVSPQAIDPRVVQLVLLSGFLLYGIAALGFGITPLWVAATLLAATVTQWVCCRWIANIPFDPRSAGISALSILLLLRVANPLWWPLTAVLAVASKFTLRDNTHGHWFNPANVAIAVVILFSGQAWLSPGQWGYGAFWVLLLLCAGIWHTHRAFRADIALMFLGFMAAGYVLRALWLGDPWAIPLHQLHNGALLLFAFFMISDPKTTPQRWEHRGFFAFCVAMLTLYGQFVVFRADSVMFALVAVSAGWRLFSVCRGVGRVRPAVSVQ